MQSILMMLIIIIKMMTMRADGWPRLEQTNSNEIAEIAEIAADLIPASGAMIIRTALIAPNHSVQLKRSMNDCRVHVHITT